MLISASKLYSRNFKLIVVVVSMVIASHIIAIVKSNNRKEIGKCYKLTVVVLSQMVETLSGIDSKSRKVK